MAIGLSREMVDYGNPTDLKPYVKAYSIRRKEQDADCWRMGIYFMRAMSVCFNFSTEKIEYFDKPLIEEMEYINSEQYKIDKQKELMAMLETMQLNFERSKKNGNR